MFPYHEEITLMDYRIAIFRYFDDLKYRENKLSHFADTYFSENGITWALLNDVRYFTVSTGTTRYYGKQACNF